jgi:tRNA A-37 threonylcarbamoyl transferase component Bud32
MEAPTGDDDFEHWWKSEGKWIEPPNQRRGGQSGVRVLQRRNVADAVDVADAANAADAVAASPLLYCKRQIGHVYRSLRYPLGRPTALREQMVYQLFERLGIRVPRLIYCGARKQDGQWQALLVTEALEDGFVSLDQWYGDMSREEIDSPLGRSVLRQLGATLARLHLSRWQHGCCYPKHLFVRVRKEGGDTGSARVDIAMLDLEKSRRRWRVQAASRHDLSQLWRHRGPMSEADWKLMREAYDSALADETLT